MHAKLPEIATMLRRFCCCCCEKVEKSSPEPQATETTSSKPRPIIVHLVSKESDNPAFTDEVTSKAESLSLSKETEDGELFVCVNLQTFPTHETQVSSTSSYSDNIGFIVYNAMQ